MFRIFIFLALMTGVAHADVYVVTDKSNRIYSLSEENDAVIPKDYTLTILKGQKISNLPITGDSSLYNFIGGAFTINQPALQAKQTAEQNALAAATAATNAKASALAKLTDAITKVNPADVLTSQEIDALIKQ